MNVRPIRLDFIGGKTRPTLSRWGLLIVGCVIVGWSGSRYVDAVSTHEVLQHRYDKAMHRTAAAERPIQRTPVDARVRAEQVKAVNPIIRNLNLPWDVIFRAVQPHKDMQVILLGLDTAGRTSVLRISGQAVDPQEMTDYVAYLAEKPQLRNVYLLKHEILRDGGYRFDVEVAWKDM